MRMVCTQQENGTVQGGKGKTMTCLEHYFENLLFSGADCSGDYNKNALTKAERNAVEICSYYVIYSLFNGRDEFKRFVKKELAEVVRCKECKHFKRDIPCVGGTYNGCDLLEGMDGCEPYVEEDFYCAYGEREDNEVE